MNADGHPPETTKDARTFPSQIGKRSGEDLEKSALTEVIWDVSRMNKTAPDTSTGITAVRRTDPGVLGRDEERPPWRKGRAARGHLGFPFPPRSTAALASEKTEPEAA